MRGRQSTFATRHLAPEGIRRSVTSPLQADVQPLLLARRQQQHVIRESDLGAQSDRSSHVDVSHSDVLALPYTDSHTASRDESALWP